MLDKSNYRELKKQVLIKECYEEMVALDRTFLYFTPHPYLSKGAPYKDKDPFYLRKFVVEKLKLAAAKLDSLYAGYKLKIFDAYRPIEVQKFMIEYEINRIALEKFNENYSLLELQKQKEVDEIISHYWSPISDEIALNPPPHSTGGALDLTIVDINGIELDMGTKIDELIDASESSFYNNSETVYEKNRALLVEVMSYAGFTQLPTEWWHFSYGDQTWALDNEKSTAFYAQV